MAEKKAEEKEGGAEAAAPKKSKKKLLLILIPVVLLVLGAAAFFLLGSKKEEPKEGAEHAAEEEAAKPKKLATLKLDTFIVNLNESTSFLKTTLLLEYDPEVFVKAEKAESGEHGEAHGGGAGGGGGGEKEGAAEPHKYTERQPMVRDAIIRILSSKTAAEVLSADGKEKLKEEIVEAVNEAIGLAESPVTNVYFIEFIVQ